jgi:hypothetical protein
MSMIGDLIKLNREAVGPAPGELKRSAFRRRKGRSRAWTDLDRVEQRVEKNYVDQLFTNWDVSTRKRERRRAEGRWKRFDEIHRKTRGWLPRQAGRSGTAQVESQWVGLIVSMQPRVWYGLKVLEQLTGRRKPVNWGCSWATQVFLEKARNPNYRGELFRLSHKRKWEEINSGKAWEPRQLWRLNRWGEALREAVLDNPQATTINLFALDGAKPEIWRKASRKRRKPRGGRLFEGSAAEQGRSPMS